MASILKIVGDYILKAVPGQGVRTYFFAALGLIYALVGGILGHLTWEQAGVLAAQSIALLTAAKHKP